VAAAVLAAAVVAVPPSPIVPAKAAAEPAGTDTNPAVVATITDPAAVDVAAAAANAPNKAPPPKAAPAVVKLLTYLPILSKLSCVGFL
jgi:hypothetical protein